jgi:hypothetical protein
MTDDELEASAKDHIWGAEVGIEVARSHFAVRRDQIAAECQRRGKPGIMDRARAKGGSHS